MRRRARGSGGHLKRKGARDAAAPLAIVVYSTPDSVAAMVERFEGLTDGQKECLRLFHARCEIKEIARRLGLSPRGVEERLAAARRRIGSDWSAEAARLFAEYERCGFTTGGSTTVAEPELPPTSLPQPERRNMPLPFPTRERPHNDLTFAQKIAYALLLAAMMALIFGGAIAALSGLTEIL